MSKKPVQPQDKYVLRLPDGMRDRIKASADANNRSMNAEIVAVLEDAFPAPKPVERAMQELGMMLREFQAGERTQEEFDALPGFLQRIVLQMEQEAQSECIDYLRDGAGEPDR